MRNLILLLLSIVSFCCNERDTNADTKHNDTHTIELDIPRDSKGRSPIFEQTQQQRDFLGKLDTLEKGYDSLQIRVWYDYQMTKKATSQIVIIKKSKEWSAELQSIEWSRDDDTAYIVRRDYQYGKPVIGWDRFLDSLTKLDVFILPDQKNVPNMYISYNSSIVSVEIATKNAYRFYTYTVPKEYVDSFEQARKIEQIMDLIEEQLGFKRIRKI